MSFHLIIVDDEEAALRGLAEYINWDAIGYALSGTAHTIDEAMDLIEHEPVDVVLTDIQLEDESGLDLVGRLSKEYPRIRCVILSGHGEFEYARQAIRYGTFESPFSSMRCGARLPSWPSGCSRTHKISA